MRKETIYHASGEEVEFPRVIKSRFTKDFSWGFYCTTNIKQAKRWARRNEIPTINRYHYEENPELNILKFETTTEDWLEFVVACRGGKSHSYDIVEGPMADDEIWDYVKDYLNGRISKDILMQIVKFRYPTHQISFHTLAAFDCISFEGSEIIK